MTFHREEQAKLAKTLPCGWVVNLWSSSDGKQKCASTGWPWIFFKPMAPCFYTSGLTGENTSPGVGQCSWCSEMVPSCHGGPEFFKHTDLLCCVLCQWATTARCQPNGRAWQPLRQIPEDPAQFTQRCCFPDVGFRWLWLSHGSTDTCDLAMKKLEGEAPQQLPARLEHGDAAGDCLHLHGWVWSAAYPSQKPDFSSSPVWGQLYRNAIHYTSWVYKLIAYINKIFS